MVGEAAFIKLGFDGFYKLYTSLRTRKNKEKLGLEVSLAWRELLKGDKAVDSVIESAIAKADAAGDHSADLIKLKKVYSGRSGGTAKKASKKAGKKAKKSARKARK